MKERNPVYLPVGSYYKPVCDFTTPGSGQLNLYKIYRRIGKYLQNSHFIGFDRSGYGCKTGKHHGVIPGIGNCECVGLQIIIYIRWLAQAAQDLLWASGEVGTDAMHRIGAPGSHVPAPGTIAGHTIYIGQGGCFQNGNTAVGQGNAQYFCIGAPGYADQSVLAVIVYNTIRRTSGLGYKNIPRGVGGVYFIDFFPGKIGRIQHTVRIVCDTIQETCIGRYGKNRRTVGQQKTFYFISVAGINAVAHHFDTVRARAKSGQKFL